MASSVTWVIVLYLLCIGAGLLIFLKGKPEGNSVYDKLYRFFAQHIPNAIKGSARLCFGKRGPACIDEAWNYLVWSNNPLIQIFYLGIVCGGYLIFAMHGYPHIPNRYLGDYHKYMGFGMFLWCVYNFAMASFKDPGVVTSRNAAALNRIYPADGQIFMKGNQCTTCNFLKPGRSKHCCLCNWCVAQFDHHCIWVNNCIGLGNHYYFLAYLFSNCLICFYGVFLGTFILWDFVERRQLFEAVFIDPKTQARYPAGWLIVGQYLLSTNGYLMFVVILCSVMTVVLAGFWGWHMYLVLSGTTTNELSKWNAVRAFLEEKYGEDKEEHKSLTEAYEAQQKKIQDGEPLGKDEEVLEQPEPPTNHVDGLRNLYSRSGWGNLMTIVFPPKLHDEDWIRTQMTACKECLCHSASAATLKDPVSLDFARSGGKEAWGSSGSGGKAEESGGEIRGSDKSVGSGRSQSSSGGEDGATTTSTCSTTTSSSKSEKSGQGWFVAMTAMVYGSADSSAESGSPSDKRERCGKNSRPSSSGAQSGGGVPRSGDPETSSLKSRRRRKK